LEIGFVIDFLKSKDKSFSQKASELKNYYRSYKNLKKRIHNNTIFATHEILNNDLENFLGKLTDSDYILLKKLFRDDIKNSLEKLKLNPELKFEKPGDFCQVGMGSVGLKEAFPKLWTTGKAFFYLPTIPGVENHFKIELVSYPAIDIEIGIDDKKIKEINLDELSNKEIKFTTKPSDHLEKISEMYINTNKLWLPNLIIEKDESILLGVGIKSITNESILK